jgi:hypothetical protein
VGEFLSEEFVRMWKELFIANLKVQSRHLTGSIRGNYENLKYPAEYNPAILKMEAARPSETSELAYNSTPCNNPEEHPL